MGCIHSKEPFAGAACDCHDGSFCFLLPFAPDGEAVAVAVAKKPNPAADAAQPLRPPAPVQMPPGRDATGWPLWLAAAAGDALRGLRPRRASSFKKLDKIGSGTYSNVYKAADMGRGGAVVALKKVRFDGVGDAESARFMAREIALLRRVDGHRNVVKLLGLVTSRVATTPALYLVFEYMEHDLAGVVAAAAGKFTLPQVKCYMQQLLAGLEHCHTNGVLHRDIKCPNLLLADDGTLKIADFGLATAFDPSRPRPLTTQVVTLWYRPPELILGAASYSHGVDLWSAGCILAELLTGEPLFRGRTEVEQLHIIFKLCGTPADGYWEKQQIPQATFKPYPRRLAEKLHAAGVVDPAAVSLVETLLSIDPDRRGTATGALDSDFFKTEPLACAPASLPRYPPTKELDVKIKYKELKARAAAAAAALPGTTTAKAPRKRQEVVCDLYSCQLARSATARAQCKPERFPPPHLDGGVVDFSLVDAGDDDDDSRDCSNVAGLASALSVGHGRKTSMLDRMVVVPRSVSVHCGNGLRRKKVKSGMPAGVLIGGLRMYSVGRSTIDVRRKMKMQQLRRKPGDIAVGAPT